jgi:hypothetical protein
MDFHTYYLRCLEADKPLLLGLAQKLGLLIEQDGELVPHECTWDEIGHIFQPTGNVSVVDDQEVPEVAIVTDKTGQPYWHINVRTPYSLDEIAAAVYAKTQDAQLGAAMQQMGRFFVMGPDGRPIAPKAPARVFF